VAYLPSMLKNTMYDSFVAEHISAYHLAPLEHVFSQARMRIFDAFKTSTNGGSILCFVCKEDAKYSSELATKRINQLRIEEFDLALDTEAPYEEFRRKVHRNKYDLCALLSSIYNENKKVHIYGASTKLNTILGLCDIDPSKERRWEDEKHLGMIRYAAERSSDKWGAKTISGIEIISEEQSKQMKPDYYLVGPYHFKSEIITREREYLDNGGKLIFPLPKLQIVSKDTVENVATERSGLVYTKEE